jgi:hypothetical protein
MEQRDYILREIEKIGMMLLAIVGRLRKAATRREFEQEMELIDIDIKELFGMSIISLVRLPDEQFFPILENSAAYNDTNIELLSDMLSEVAGGLEKGDSEAALLKAIKLIEFADVRSRTFSFDRQSKLDSLKARL